MNILIAEDNKAISLVISKIVETLGHQYYIAADGEQALLMLEQRDIDLVLLDVEMPKCDGYDVAKAIRANEGNSEHVKNATWLPIIFISAHSDNKSLNKGLLAGADDYLFKPVNRLLLEAKIKLFEKLLQS